MNLDRRLSRVQNRILRQIATREYEPVKASDGKWYRLYDLEMQRRHPWIHVYSHRPGTPADKRHTEPIMLGFHKNDRRALRALVLRKLLVEANETLELAGEALTRFKRLTPAPQTPKRVFAMSRTRAARVQGAQE